jgi:hypothetical protein
MVSEANDTAKSGVATRRMKAVAGVWRSKMTKGNWIGEPHVRLGQIVDCAGEKI